MIFLDTPQVADAAEFFALEYALAVRRSTEEFYFFWQTPPTLMLGRNQVVEQEIDLSAAQRGNVAVRRRNSGGGTIYTDGGTLQISHLVQNPSDMSVQLAVETRRLADALCKLRIPAEFNSRNDILADGKKVSGAAGYSCGHCYLYHASLLWEADLPAITELLTVDEAKLKRHGRCSVRQRVTSLSRFCGWSLAEFSARLRAELAADCPHRPPTREEARSASRYEERIFSDPTWIMHGKATFGIDETNSRKEIITS